MKIFTAVLLAACVAGGAAQAKTMSHKAMRMAACGDGMAKASCLCKSATGAHMTCKKGQWCHTFTGVCTQ